MREVDCTRGNLTRTKTFLLQQRRAVSSVVVVQIYASLRVFIRFRDFTFVLRLTLRGVHGGWMFGLTERATRRCERLADRIEDGGFAAPLFLRPTALRVHALQRRESICAGEVSGGRSKFRPSAESSWGEGF